MDGGRAQLGFSLLILVALGATLALAGPGAATTPPGRGVVDAAPNALDPQQVARISVEATPRVAREVERVRGLRFDQLPKPEVVSSAFLNRLGLRQAEHQPGGLGIGADNAVGRITGLLAPDEDLGAVYDSTGDLAAAAYDPKSKRLFIVSDAVVANRALVEFVLAHELDHALEDQRFGLGGGGANEAPQRRRGSAPLRSASRLDDDAALATQALDEGSATALMVEFASRYLNPLDLLAATETIDAGTGDVPKAYVDQLTWAYLGGQRFVTALRELAGSWKLVDYAFSERPPATTEQVLHPRKYVRDERPSPVRIDGAELRRRGWTLADRNVFGELATSTLLEPGVEKPVAGAAAAGWDGDRYELWRRGVAPGACEGSCRTDLVVVASWSWDARADRDQFVDAARAYVERGLGGDELAGGTYRVPGGAARVQVGGRRRVTVVFAPTPGTARVVADAQAAAGK